MRSIVLGVLVMAAAWGAYQGWAYHQRSLGKLEAAIADDVTVAKAEKAKDAALVTLLIVQRDSAIKAGNRAVILERRRTVAVAVSDSTAGVTDSALDAAILATQDSIAKARLSAVAAVLAQERAARVRERFASDSTIEAWKGAAGKWRASFVTDSSLAASRLTRINALEAENKAVRKLLPSKIGGAVRTGGLVLLTALATQQACSRQLVKC